MQYIQEFNPHWDRSYSYNQDIRRVYFQNLKQQVENKFILLLTGLRRVWKTTLMLQLIDDLIRWGTNSHNIVYYSFDIQREISDVIEEYVKIANKNIRSDRLYFFFDEIQKVTDWQNKIKLYYDLYPNIKFILSGSSSLFLRSTESLAGRISTTHISSLFFREYLEYKKLDYYLEKPLLYYNSLLLEFEKYLYRQFYDIIDTSLGEAQEYIRDLKYKIIRDDARAYLHIEHPDILERIFDIVAAHPGMLIDYSHIANDLWIDARTVQTYFWFLSESFLLHKVYNFSRNLLTSEKKQKKIYLGSSSFFTGKGEVTGELFENYVSQIYSPRFFYRHKQREVDFIVENKDRSLTAVEVKYKTSISRKELRYLDFFAENFWAEHKLCISKNIQEMREDIEITPFWELEKI